MTDDKIKGKSSKNKRKENITDRSNREPVMQRWGQPNVVLDPNLTKRKVAGRCCMVYEGLMSDSKGSKKCADSGVKTKN